MPIEKVSGSGVATSDGQAHDVGVLIMATGFKVMDPDDLVTYSHSGPGGRSLSGFWDQHACRPTRV